MDINCEVCPDGKPSKYKCPACALRSCSLECFKKHKADDAKDSDIHCDTRKSREGPKVEEEGAPSRQSQLILDESDVIVPEWRLRKAAESLKGYLSHSKLRAVIRDIDGTVSHKKKQRLRQRIKNDPDFRVFIDDLLKEMGYLNQEGQFEVQEEGKKPVQKLEIGEESD